MTLRRCKAWHIALVAVIALSGIWITGGEAGAFALTKIAGYDIRDGVNATQDDRYGPYSGEIWADNFPNASGGQVLQADNYNIVWASEEMQYLKAERAAVAPTFHVFSGTSGSCQAPFEIDGYWISSMPGAWFEADSASCTWNGDGDYYNEAHVKAYTSDLSANVSYRGGVEFQHASGGIYSGTGRVTNDIYTFSPVGYAQEKDHAPTWCFNQSGGAYWC